MKYNDAANLVPGDVVRYTGEAGQFSSVIFKRDKHYTVIAERPRHQVGWIRDDRGEEWYLLDRTNEDNIPWYEDFELVSKGKDNMSKCTCNNESKDSQKKLDQIVNGIQKYLEDSDIQNFDEIEYDVRELFEYMGIELKASFSVEFIGV